MINDPKYDVGYDSGKGTINNPNQIEEVVITLPKKTDPNENQKWFDKLIQGVDSLGNFVGKLTGNNDVSFSTTEKVGDTLAKITEKSREFSLSNNTKAFMLLGGVGLISYFFYQKNNK